MRIEPTASAWSCRAASATRAVSSPRHGARVCTDAGATPSADQWDALAALLAKTGADTILWEAAPPQEAIARAEDMGLRSVIFPPRAAPPADGNFLSSMAGVLDALEAQ